MSSMALIGTKYPLTVNVGWSANGTVSSALLGSLTTLPAWLLTVTNRTSPPAFHDLHGSQRVSLQYCLVSEDAEPSEFPPSPAGAHIGTVHVPVLNAGCKNAVTGEHVRNQCLRDGAVHEFPGDAVVPAEVTDVVLKHQGVARLVIRAQYRVNKCEVMLHEVSDSARYFNRDAVDVSEACDGASGKFNVVDVW